MKKTLTFERDNGTWYIVLPNWIGPKHNLMMVAGADTLLDQVSSKYGGFDGEGYRKFGVEIITNSKTDITRPDCITYKRKDWTLAGGANYECIHATKIEDYKPMWLCPVTLFVYGKYPEYITIPIKTVEREV